MRLRRPPLLSSEFASYSACTPKTMRTLKNKLIKHALVPPLGQAGEHTTHNTQHTALRMVVALCTKMAAGAPATPAASDQIEALPVDGALASSGLACGVAKLSLAAQQRRGLAGGDASSSSREGSERIGAASDKAFSSSSNSSDVGSESASPLSRGAGGVVAVAGMANEPHDGSRLARCAESLF